MGFIESIDPFVMQLVIVPLVVIGLGVLIAVITKRVLIGAIITLFLNLLYELWSYITFYHINHPPSITNPFTSWNVIFPVCSLMFSSIAVQVRTKRHRKK